MNSTEVDQLPDLICVDMTKTAKGIEQIRVSPVRREQIADCVTKQEERQVWTIGGKLFYMGVAESPFCAFAARFMQQRIPEMTIGSLMQMNALIRDTTKKHRTVLYLQTDEQEKASRERPLQ